MFVLLSKVWFFYCLYLYAAFDETDVSALSMLDPEEGVG